MCTPYIETKQNLPWQRLLEFRVAIVRTNPVNSNCSPKSSLPWQRP